MIFRNLRLTMRHRLRFAKADAGVSMPVNGGKSNVHARTNQNLMKKSMLWLVALFIFTSVALKAQSPQKINFQSIVRNTSGEIVSNKSVSFKITILSGSITGTPVYSETHLKTTDAIGLLSLQIGTGTVASGVFSSIDWGNTVHFIKLDADFSGGNTYVNLGIQELMSVPYAMYAAKTDTASLNLTNRLADKAPVNNPTFTGTVGGITKAMVGLENVENTTDVNKPVSSATQTALAAKAPLASPTFTGTVGGITKAMVGLGDVNNTTDVDKPVSSATQAALAAKAPLASPTFTGTVGGITKAMVGLENVENTADLSKPVSSATQAALAAKAPLASPTFTGTVGGITQAMVGLGNVDNTADLSKPVSSATQKALDTKFNKADFPSPSSANQILYWNGTNWVSLSPGTTGQVLTMSSTGLSWGCIVTNTAASPSNVTLVATTPLTPITIATTGATGIDLATGLPAGVTAVWLNDVITISGTPTAAGTFNYTIPLTGGCGSASATGTITVDPAPVCPSATITYNSYAYKTVSIGTQCWMAENLRTDKYNDGTTVIPDETSNSGWAALTTGARTEYVAAGVTNYVGTYGYLYNWYAVNDSRKLCPVGWDVPSNEEWSKLVLFLGTTNTAGGKMKSTGTTYWSSESAGTDNSSGFSALPGGMLYGVQGFANIRDITGFWSATETQFDAQQAQRFRLSVYDSSAIFGSDLKSYGLSVRCLRD